MNKFYRNTPNWFLIASAVILSIGAIEVRSQNVLVEATLPISIEWSEGSIMTNDGTELKGLLKYNDKNALLSYQDGTDSRSFNARNVAGFEFFDYSTEKQRVFYSLPYEDPQNNIKRPLFFEVIKEFDGFAVLSKVDPIEIDHNSIVSPAAYDPYASNFTRGTNYGTRTEISQTEIIYLMDAKANIRPYVKIVETEVDGAFGYETSKTKNKIIDDDLLEQYVGPNNYKSLVSYAKENKLSFNRKSDLIKILDYYSELLN